MAMYDFSSGFNVINSALANIGKNNELNWQREQAAKLGGALVGGNYMDAARQAFASGDSATGIALIKLATEQANKAASRQAVSSALSGVPLAPLGGAAAPVAGAPVAGGPLTETGAPVGLIGNESGGSFTAQNRAVGSGGHVGHFGRGQFGIARLQEAKAAGIIPAGMTAQQFMADPEGQKAVERWHFSDIEAHARAKGYDRLIGQTINGVPITMEGMKAAAHLGGKGGLDRYIASGGRYNPADINGTRLSNYFQRFGSRGPQRQADAPQGAPAEGPGGQPGFVIPGTGEVIRPWSPEDAALQPNEGAPTTAPLPPSRPLASDLPATTPPPAERGLFGTARDLLFPKSGRYEPGGAGYQPPTPALERIPDDPRALAYAAQRAAGRAPLPAEAALPRAAISTPEAGATVVRPRPVPQPMTGATFNAITSELPKEPGGLEPAFQAEGVRPAWGGTALAPLGAPRAPAAAYTGGGQPRRAPAPRAAPPPAIRQPVAAPVAVAPRPIMPDLTSSESGGSREFAMSQGANAPGAMNFGSPREVLAGQQAQQRQAAAARPTPAQPAPKVVKPPAAGYSSLPPGGGQPYSPPLVAPGAGGGLTSGAVPPGGPSPSAAPATPPSGGPAVAPVTGDNPAALRAQAATLAQSNPEAARQLTARAALAEQRPAATPRAAPMAPLGGGGAVAPAVPTRPPVAAPVAPAAVPAAPVAAPAAPAQTAQAPAPVTLAAPSAPAVQTPAGVLPQSYLANPRIRNMIAAMAVADDDGRAVIKSALDLEVKAHERALDAQKPPDGSPAQFVWARRNGLTKANTPAEYEGEMAAAKREPFTEKPSELRKELFGLDAYKKLSVANSTYDSMLSAAHRNTLASDLNMVYAFATMMDPGSVVREGEQIMVKRTQGLPDQLLGAISAVNGKAALSTDARIALLDEAKSRRDGYKAEFDRAAQQFTGIAQRAKLNPADIVPQFGEAETFARQGPPIPPEVRHAEANIPRLTDISQTRGMPRGTKFFDPEGTLRTVP